LTGMRGSGNPDGGGKPLDPRLPMRIQQPEDRSQNKTDMVPILTPDSYSHASLCSPIMAVRGGDGTTKWALCWVELY
jgi:hypothetical protein